MNQSRRTFVKQSALLGAGFIGLRAFAGFASNTEINPLLSKYGELVKDPKGLLNLPKGFTYKIISSTGEKMDDGLLVPGAHDGSASFQGKKGVILVRNHEITPDSDDIGAFGKRNKLLKNGLKSKFYDFGFGKEPGLGGTTTVLFDEEKQEVISQHMSLFGTTRNCAGGKTPWNTWITCEETVHRSNKSREKDHGYNFEVPAGENGETATPIPLKEMGRMNHEAVAVDPKTGIVYQTEDRHDGLIYRFIPNEKGQLSKGGRLEILAIKGQPSYDTRNWPESESPAISERDSLEVDWLPIDDVESPEDDLRFRGYEKGAARFARGEGAWFGEGEFYFACTNGGKNKTGQIWRYSTSPYEGTSREQETPARVELFAEPNNSDIMKYCDNLTIAPSGDLLLCEDHPQPFVVGITPKGEYYKLAENIGHRSEMTGINFSPSGRTLFVNIQRPGLTLAIQGPFS